MGFDGQCCRTRKGRRVRRFDWRDMPRRTAGDLPTFSGCRRMHSTATGVRSRSSSATRHTPAPTTTTKCSSPPRPDRSPHSPTRRKRAWRWRPTGLARGKAIYLATAAQPSPIGPLIRSLYIEPKIDRGPVTPTGVVARVVDGCTMYVNANNAAITVTIDGTKTDVLTGKIYTGKMNSPTMRSRCCSSGSCKGRSGAKARLLASG